MKNKITLLLAVTLVMLTSSCIFMGPWVEGNGNVEEENRKTGEFKEIEVSRGMNVYITQGEITKVVVKADENLLEIIETRTEGDKLIVTAKQNIRRAESKKVFVTTPKITKIKSSSGSNVYSETKIVSKDLELSTSSGSNMTLEIESENVDASASSGSNIKLQAKSENLDASASAGSNIRIEGRTDNFSAKVSSGANIKAKELTSENCDLTASSGGNIWITVNDELVAKASSGGNVFYAGSPKSTNIENSSGGNVKKD